jgi:hypothetical protein
VITGCHLRYKDSELGALRANVDALIEDLRILGGGLVRDIIVSKNIRPPNLCKEENES